MNQPAQSTRGRGRPKRDEQVQTRRRQRTQGVRRGKLVIPDNIKKEHPEMEFRWAIDDAGRMQQLTVDDDWTPVPSIKDIHAGTNNENKPVKHVLLMKPKAFMEEDRAAKRAQMDQLEASKFTPRNPEQALAAGETSYMVSGSRIE